MSTLDVLASPKPKPISLPWTPISASPSNKKKKISFMTPSPKRLIFSPKTPSPPMIQSSPKLLLTSPPKTPTITILPSPSPKKRTLAMNYQYNDKNPWWNWNQLAIDLSCSIYGVDQNCIYIPENMPVSDKQIANFIIKPISCPFDSPEIGHYSATGCKKVIVFCFCSFVVLLHRM
jgi:hypothetical protein